MKALFLRRIAMVTILAMSSPAWGAVRPNSIMTVAVTGNALTGSGAAKIMLTSQGDENALGCSVTFDPTVLRYDGFANGADLNGATLNMNVTQASSGKIGIALALPANSTFAVGSRHLVTLNFAVVATSPISTTIGFGDVPVFREVSDVTANVLGATFTPLAGLAVNPASPASTAPTITTQPRSRTVVAGASVSFTVVAGGNPTPTFQWRKAGTNIAGAINATFTINPVTAGDAGSYGVVASNGTLPNATSNAAILTVIPIGPSTPTVVGSADVASLGIVHPNGNVYDQLLLTGSSATIAAATNKITRTSFIDLNDDIVQVEVSGAGTLTFVLENASGPTEPVNYNQPGVFYMKGHASLAIAGADESTNVTVFSVGRLTAFDPTGAFNFTLPVSATNNPAINGSPLFQGHASTNYDGVADLGLITITSTDGMFGGVRTANASFFATAGNTGIYAPGVQFTGPVYVGDINASGSATPVLLLGSASDTRINGGDLLQSDAQPVKVSGITHLQFVNGVTSQNLALPAQANKAVLQQNGVDVTSQIVNPTN